MHEDLTFKRPVQTLHNIIMRLSQKQKVTKTAKITRREMFFERKQRQIHRLLQIKPLRLCLRQIIEQLSLRK